MLMPYARRYGTGRLNRLAGLSRPLGSSCGMTPASNRRWAMDFYEFSNNSIREPKWTYAASIHAMSHVVQWSCDECGRAADYPAGAFDVTLEGGDAFPDLLGCGAYP